MDEDKKGIYRIVLIAIIVISLGMLFFENVDAFTGKVVESSTPSNVTIQKYLAISLCDNLASGINFGDVSSLPAVDINASHNYDGGSSGSTYCINVSDDGNSAIDLCIGANDDLTSPSLDTIGLGNETYSNYTDVTNSTIPSLSDQTALTTSYQKSGVNVGTGSTNYYRFWLDVPAAQASGDYNNTVYFKGVTTSTSCGAGP